MSRITRIQSARIGDPPDVSDQHFDPFERETALIKRECNDVVCLAADLDDLDLNDPDQRIEFLDICGQIRDRIFKVQQKIGEVYR